MDVIIAGGGVAGAASAIALRRIGARVTVQEAYADPAGRVGSFLSLAANGLRGLEALGCLEPVRRAGFAVPLQRIRAESGRILGEVPRGRLSGDAMHSTTLRRGHLVEVLREHALRAGARIVTGRRLVGAVEDGGGVRAEFDDGTHATADLLVGADGLWSVTRSLLDPDAPWPEYAGLYGVSGIAEGVPTEPGVFDVSFARSGAFLHVVMPDGAVWWTAQVAERRPPDFAATGDEQWLDHLAGLYRFCPRAPELLRATKRLHRPALVHTLAEVPVRHDDRTVLVGDAAHPVGAGQGASMAIEDAVVLAQALAGADSVGAALADHDRRRRARIGRMFKAARGNRGAKTRGPVGRRVEGLVMPIVLRHFHERSTAWLYTHDLGTLPAPARGTRPAGV
ncbi:salicylate 1-monooxygenase [Streptomyces carminius]|uniref:Salicylate 1-monooxygenase n=1 Tax=Streptomyces carminius TaxID=2665496 RepID=A0A2M8LTK4_9ACTN|nr:FAD-dependent monooxygenase [Streptomyces carminius]PJE95287.1 salicylate 1-monooxygenase [Streptomyces carminius]